MRIAWIAVLVTSCGMGCAKLSVQKISHGEIANHADDKTTGFRYYLSRPYLVVKRPVLVLEHRELFLAPERPDAAENTSVTRYHRQGFAEGSTVVTGDNEALSRAMDRAEGFAEAGGKPGKKLGGGRSPRRGEDDDGPLENPPSGENSVALSDDLEIIFLPDLDEQYAVHGKNGLSHHKYALTFQDGWMLTGVNVDTDSTPVAIEIFNVVQSAIESTRNVTTSGILAGGDLGLIRTRGLSEVAPHVTTDDKIEMVLYERVSRTALKPGVYRINKPWEVNGVQPVGLGLIAQLGIPTVETVIERRAASDGNAPARLPDILRDLDDPLEESPSNSRRRRR